MTSNSFNLNLRPLKMTDLIPVENTTSKIFMIRGLKVMIDRDLAELYGVSTKRLKEQVRRNISRFPEDFMLQLSEGEEALLRSQIATLEGKGKHSKLFIHGLHGTRCGHTLRCAAQQTGNCCPRRKNRNRG